MENQKRPLVWHQSFFQEHYSKLSQVLILGLWPEVLKHLSKASDISDEYFKALSDEEQVFHRAIRMHEKENPEMSIYECILRDMIGALELEKALDGCRRRVAKSFWHNSSMSEYDAYIHLLEDEIQAHHTSKTSSK